MKKYLRNLSCFVAGTMLIHNVDASSVPVTGVAVVVGDSVITLGEIDSMIMGPAQLKAKAYGDGPRLEQEISKLRDEAIEQRIEEKLIVHDFVSSGYVTNVLEAFVDEEIQRKIQERYYGDRARMIRTLHEQGLTYEMFRRQEREKFIVDYMTYQNSSNPRKIIISPLKIDQYYNTHKDEFEMTDQVKLLRIVLPQSADGAPNEAKKLGEEILAQIDSGVPFAEMASVYSAAPALERSQGGDWGWQDRKTMNSDMAAIAFSLKPGQHSGIIEQPGACYLLMVQDAKAAHVKELTEVRAEIERTLRNEETLRLRKLWIQRLKRKSFVMTY